MNNVDPKSSSFSESQGYESLPRQLHLEELSEEARVQLWNVLVLPSMHEFDSSYTHPWREIFTYIYSNFLNRLLTSEILEYADVQRLYDQPIREFILKKPFNKVFDLLLAIMRHEKCPKSAISQLAEVFQDCRLAYVLDKGPPPTIYPATTPEEGSAVVDSLKQLRSTGLGAPRQHLQLAAENINKQDWAGSVRESIHAVESVARQIAPRAKTLGEALRVLEKEHLLVHTALRDGFSKIYGYTNDEQGIRHALLESDKSNVGQEEAVFMLGACASFASYLSRKQVALGKQDSG